MSGLAVLVTGASGGIGRATCRRLVRDGYWVHAVDRDLDELRELQAELGDRCAVSARDLTERCDYADLVAGSAGPSGRLYGLVHTAAVLRRRSELNDITEDDWDVQIDTNLKTTFFLNRCVANRLREQRHGGAIVNFASQGWWSGGYGGSVVYAASKGGVVSMSRGLARSLASYGIRVNVVAPGFVDTAMMRQGLTEEELAANLAQVPTGRLAEPEEIADATVFLLSPDSRYMTGATLNVSGGQLVY